MKNNVVDCENRFGPTVLSVGVHINQDGSVSHKMTNVRGEKLTLPQAVNALRLVTNKMERELLSLVDSK